MPYSTIGRVKGQQGDAGDTVETPVGIFALRVDSSGQLVADYLDDETYGQGDLSIENGELVYTYGVQP